MCPLAEVPATTAEAVLKPSTKSFCADKLRVVGYKFKNELTGAVELDYDKLFDTFKTTGIQAKELATAVDIVNEMLAERQKPFQSDATIEDECIRPQTGCTIFLSYTALQVRHGFERNIYFLTKRRLVDCLVTTLEAIELELGLRNDPSEPLQSHPYATFIKEHMRSNKLIIDPSKLVHWLGLNASPKGTICYCAAYHKIPIFCPSTSSLVLKQVLDLEIFKDCAIFMDKVADIRRINTFAHNTESAKTGVIIIGGGVPKHHTMNANLMRNGADYSVYLNTATEFDASDSGAEPDEAVSWGKMRINAKSAKVNCDPTISFPLLVLRTFLRWIKEPRTNIPLPPPGADSVRLYEDEQGQAKLCYRNFFESFSNTSTNFQGAKLASAVLTVKQMIKERKLSYETPNKIQDDSLRPHPNVTIFLVYTSNMISSGVREHIKFLVEQNLVDCLTTTAGGIEEDLIKCLGSSEDGADTYVGNFRTSGSSLREHGINRIGNLFVPNDNYCRFEDWLIPILDKMLGERTIWSTSKLIERLGLEINHPDSVYYWAAKNKIPVFCPAITDGSLGDMLHFHSYRSPGLVVEDLSDEYRIQELYENSRQCGALMLGSGEAKSFVESGRNFKYKIHIDSTRGSKVVSDVSPDLDENTSLTSLEVKVTCDATIALPIIIAQGFITEV